MAVMLASLYDALKAANVPDDKAGKRRRKGPISGVKSQM